MRKIIYGTAYDTETATQIFQETAEHFKEGCHCVITYYKKQKGEIFRTVQVFKLEKNFIDTPCGDPVIEALDDQREVLLYIQRQLDGPTYESFFGVCDE